MTSIPEAIDKVTHGVYVICAKSGDKLAGMTAAWVSQVSFQPPLFMVSIAPKRYTHGIIEDGKAFSINVLGTDQRELAEFFGYVSGWKEDKLSKYDYTTGATGAPILNDALAYLECEVIASHTAGDHTMFIGKPVDGGVQRKGRVMVFRFKNFF